MKHLITKEKNILHGTIGWSHNGKDGQYCEAGETVKIKWQPDAGWGLYSIAYQVGDDEVSIDGGEFIMPDGDVTIYATFKKFSLDDWKAQGIIEGDITASGNIEAQGNLGTEILFVGGGIVMPDGEGNRYRFYCDNNGHLVSEPY